MNDFLKKNPESIHLGAISAMISKLVSKGQQKCDEANSYNLPQAELYVAGRMGEENYRAILDMVESYKQAD